MKSIVRVNGVIREDIGISLDTDLMLLIVASETGRMIVKQKSNSVLAEINLYGDLEIISQGIPLAKQSAEIPNEN